MPGYQPFDETYEQLIERPSAAYRAAVGPPVNRTPEAFEELLTRLRHFRDDYPNMAFWQMIDYKTLDISHSEGDLEVFGHKLTSVKDFFRQIHPDYVMPFLRWRTAAYNLIFKQEMVINPMEAAYRIPLPLQVLDGQYFWFYMNSTIVQVDAEGRIVTNMQTFYREGKWSERNLRPMEANIQIRNIANNDFDDQLISQLSLQIIDEFTDAELGLLALYAAGKKTEEVLREKGWSRHTLHEYNANLLRKAKTLFVYDFRSARDFAGYCIEKGFIRLKN
ncbi:MAG: hypothetical protein IPM98_14060 [Lewinellaceae bacterium]|nr:hypothetical protein [Lewinellaceae bacterium]